MKLAVTQQTTSQIDVLKHLLATYNRALKNGGLDSWLEIHDNVVVYNVFNKLKRELNKQEGHNDRTGNANQ